MIYLETENEVFIKILQQIILQTIIFRSILGRIISFWFGLDFFAILQLYAVD